MPLPLLHAAAGLAVYQIAKKEDDWRLALTCMALANAADLDFIPGILVGKPDLFHHSFTHSFTMAAVVGLGIATFARIWKNRGFWKNFFISFAAYSTHVVLDLIFDHSLLPVVWPLTPGKFLSRIAAFDPERIHLGGFDNFVCDRFLSLSCLRRVTQEIIVVGIIGTAFLIYSELKKKTKDLSLPLFSEKD